MDKLHDYKVNKDSFHVFIRDLSESVNANLKHMVEDYFQPSTTICKNSKVELMKQDWAEKRHKTTVEADYRKIDNLKEYIDDKNPFEHLYKLQTNEGRNYYKYLLLKRYWKSKTNLDMIIGLYYQLVNTKSDKYDSKLIDKIRKQVESPDSEPKLYMLENLGYMLPPLNFWDKPTFVLDDWQKETCDYIQRKESVIIRAPTSSGKSFVGMACGVIHKKVMYVCPSVPVVYQVGSHFVKMGYRVHYIVPGLSDQSVQSGTNIFIGTPSEIEDCLSSLSTTFDYAVYDEIHNVNREKDGHCYENLIKLLPSDFLVLSATIQNGDYLHELFQKIHPTKQIHYIDYSKRFINIQRWNYQENQLNKLHPMACLTLDDMNESLMELNLPMTPNDMASLWSEIEELYEDVDDLSPDVYFETYPKDQLLTLNDCRDYELFLKRKLIELKQEDPDTMKQLLMRYHQKYTPSKNDYVKLCKQLEEKDMFPMIMFNTSEEHCKDIFFQMYRTLVSREEKEFPYYYDIMEKKNELYNEYKTKKYQYVNKISIDKNVTDVQSYKEEKVNQYDRTQKDIYVQTVDDYYNKCIHKITQNSKISDLLKKLQIKNLKREQRRFLRDPDFRPIDIFQKHPKYCFTMKSPMSGDTIRSIRKKVNTSMNANIPYEHPVFQMLKRGIGIYTSSMPEAYNQCIHKLLSEKEISVVISDKTLCEGIDLPIRTTCLCKHAEDDLFTNEDYLQMSGRAGRRGHDNQGNVVFCNIDYKELMRGTLPLFKGTEKPIHTQYSVLNKLNSKVNVDCVFKNFINENKCIVKNHFDDIHSKDIIRLQWLLRDYETGNDYIRKIQTLERILFIEKDKLMQEKECIECLCILIPNDTLFYDYKNNIVNKDMKLIMKLIQHTYNTLNRQKFICVRQVYRRIFDTYTKLSTKQNGFE
jgi:superfamily II RNA helicase